MMTSWYYQKGAEAAGPVTEADSEHLILSGEIRRETLVWCAGMENWAPARESALSVLLARLPPPIERPGAPPPIPAPPEAAPAEPVVVEALPVEMPTPVGEGSKGAPSASVALASAQPETNDEEYAAISAEYLSTNAKQFKQRLDRIIIISLALYAIFFSIPYVVNIEYPLSAQLLVVIPLFGAQVLFLHFVYLIWMEVPRSNRIASPLLLMIGLLIHQYLSMIVVFFAIFGLAREAYSILAAHEKGKLGKVFRQSALAYCLAFSTLCAMGAYQDLTRQVIPPELTGLTLLSLVVAFLVLLFNARNAGVALREINLAEAAEQGVTTAS